MVHIGFLSNIVGSVKSILAHERSPEVINDVERSTYATTSHVGFVLSYTHNKGWEIADTVWYKELRANTANYIADKLNLAHWIASNISKAVALSDDIHNDALTITEVVEVRRAIMAHSHNAERYIKAYEARYGDTKEYTMPRPGKTIIKS